MANKEAFERKHGLRAQPPSLLKPPTGRGVGLVFLSPPTSTAHSSAEPRARTLPSTRTNSANPSALFVVEDQGTEPWWSISYGCMVRVGFPFVACTFGHAGIGLRPAQHIYLCPITSFRILSTEDSTSMSRRAACL